MKVISVSYADGIATYNPRTLEECKDLCEATDGCLSINWSNSTATPYPHDCNLKTGFAIGPRSTAYGQSFHNFYLVPGE